MVFGGGRVAERKVKPLLKAGAAVTVISPDITAGIEALVSSGVIEYKPRKYRKGDAEGAFLVIAATSDEKVNGKISKDVHGLVNAVDMPDYSSFIVPSVVRKGPLSIAISTSGISPSLSRTIRLALEEHIPDAAAKYLGYLRGVRQRIMTRRPDSSKEGARRRALLLKKVGSKEAMGILKAKGFLKAKKYVEALLEKELK